MEAVRFVVRRRSAVSVEAHVAVAVIVHHRTLRLVDRQRIVVDADAVTVGVRIGDQASLQHLVGRISHARHDVLGIECRLLHFGKIVFRIAIQHQLADFDKRIVFVRPNLGEVERIDGISLRFFFRHDLNAHAPLGEVFPGDGVEEIALRVVRIYAPHRRRVFAREVLDSLFRLEVILHVKEFVVGIDQAESVAAEAVHVAKAVGRAAVGKKNCDLVQRFRRQ